jgi:hypothetical protein
MHRGRTPSAFTGRAVERLVIGAVGGIAATWAMTVAMNVLFRRLPDDEQYPLPPREITETLLPASSHISEDTIAACSLAAHAAYGAAAGSVFTLSGVHQHRPVVRGMMWGLVVWSISYLGWLPMAGILKPAIIHPMRRNMLMIIVHLVWGGGTGLAVSTLNNSMMPLRKNRLLLMKDVDDQHTRLLL